MSFSRILAILLVFCGSNTLSQTFDLDSKEVSIGDVYISDPKILFDLDKWAIRADSKAQLHRIIEFLNTHPKIEVEVGVHLDLRLPKDLSSRLDKRRAESIVQYLSNNGIKRNRLIAVGYGSSKPIYTAEQISNLETEDEKEAAHWQNRRTEFKVIWKTPPLEESDEYEYWILTQNLPSGFSGDYLEETGLSDSLKYSNFQNPFYLEEDFNGDSQLDHAVWVENKLNQKKGLLIIHGGDKKSHFLIGAGKELETGTDDYSWVEVWKVYRESTISELTYTEDWDIDGHREFSISASALELFVTESGGGIIYWDGEKYKWAQTRD